MKKAIIAITIAAGTLVGCKSITVERRASTLATVADSNGVERVAFSANGSPIILDGGWEVSYFQHWNWQKLDSLTATAGPGVSLALNGYEGGADASNLVALVETSFKGAAELTAKIGAAIATSGGSVAGEAAATALSSCVARFVKRGGDAAKATVTCADGSCTISDGTISEVCESCYECTP